MIKKIIDIAGNVLEKVLPGPEAQKARQEFQLQLASMLLEEDQQLRQFFLEYEGRASEVPRAVQLARTLIRPFFTWLFGLIGAGWIIGQALGLVHSDMPSALSTWVTLTLGFWFGGRIAEKIKGVA